MQILRWKMKKVIGIFVAIILIYLWIRPRKFGYKAETQIPKTKPSDVWEYVADFSHMVHLNPTIVNFSILSESGNFAHWKYQTKYIEKLSHWPYLKNIGIGDYSVHSEWRKDIYIINSTHTTCFFQGLYCLHSDSTFKFSTVNNILVGAEPDALVVETVYYECPPFLYIFCQREVAFQRKNIMKNLYNYFVERK